MSSTPPPKGSYIIIDATTKGILHCHRCHHQRDLTLSSMPPPKGPYIVIDATTKGTLHCHRCHPQRDLTLSSMPPPKGPYMVIDTNNGTINCHQCQQRDLTLSSTGPHLIVGCCTIKYRLKYYIFWNMKLQTICGYSCE